MCHSPCCVRLCNPMDYSPARLLCPWGFPRPEYCSELPLPSPGGSSQPRDRTWVSCIGRRILDQQIQHPESCLRALASHSQAFASGPASTLVGELFCFLTNTHFFFLSSFPFACELSPRGSDLWDRFADSPSSRDGCDDV